MGFFIGKCNEALRFMGPSLQIRQCRLDGLNDFHLQKNQQVGVLGVGVLGVGGHKQAHPRIPAHSETSFQDGRFQTEQQKFDGELTCKDTPPPAPSSPLSYSTYI